MRVKVVSESVRDVTARDMLVKTDITFKRVITILEIALCNKIKWYYLLCINISLYHYLFTYIMHGFCCKGHAEMLSMPTTSSPTYLSTGTDANMHNAFLPGTMLYLFILANVNAADEHDSYHYQQASYHVEKLESGGPRILCRRYTIRNSLCAAKDDSGATCRRWI